MPIEGWNTAFLGATSTTRMREVAATTAIYENFKYLAILARKRIEGDPDGHIRADCRDLGLGVGVDVVADRRVAVTAVLPRLPRRFERAYGLAELIPLGGL